MQKAHTQEARAATPIYLQIQGALKERIVSGTYAVSTLLPTEAELCAEFGASRFTVREALRGLTAQGYVQRRQRTGTIVVASDPRIMYTQSVHSIEDLFQIAMETHYVMLDSRPVELDAAIAPRVGGAAGERWFRVTGVRWTEPGGSPICYIDSYIPLRFAEAVRELPRVRGAFYAALERSSGEPIEKVVQEINAVPMPAEAVRALGLEDGSLSLCLLRRYETRQGTIIASFNWHRADQFTYRMEMRRSEGL